MDRDSSRRRNKPDGLKRRYCQRCGVEFTVHGDYEPEMCYGCEEDLVEDEVDLDEFTQDHDGDEFLVADWTEDSTV